MFLFAVDIDDAAVDVVTVAVGVADAVEQHPFRTC